jgi:UDP-glucuronate 4-epimerase
MKILVTGSAGFIGFHTALMLLQKGFHITGLDSLNAYYDVKLKYARLAETGIARSQIRYDKAVNSTLYPNYRFYHVKLEHKQQLASIFEAEKFDMVVHLAAQAGVRYSLEEPDAYISSNITGFLNILECCRQFQIKHLVYASSSSVYGLNDQLPFSTSAPTEHPISLYAATKKSNELMAHTYSHLFRVPTTGLRFFTVYGPWGRPDMALFIFTKNILEGRPIQLYNNGEMIRDFTYVSDIAEGICKVLTLLPTPDPAWKMSKGPLSASSAPYKIYNIGNSYPVRLLDYVLALESALGKKALKEWLPLQPGDVPAAHSDVSDFTLKTDYKPFTPVLRGVQSFVDWYRTYYQV